jgi:hypothetical protein
MTNADFTNVQVGLMNYLVYGFAIAQEVLGYIFNLATGHLAWTAADDGQLLLTGQLPTLTDKGQDIVGAIMTIVHNGLVFAAEFSTLLPANALS